MSSLVGLDGGHMGNPSASQRREALLNAKCQHFQSVIAVLVVQMGGKAIVPGASLRTAYDLGVAADPMTGTLSFTAAPATAEAPPAESEKEPT